MFKKGGVVAWLATFCFNMNENLGNKIDLGLNTIQEVKALLKSKIFVLQTRKSYIFGDEAYAVLPGDFSFLMRRNNVVWENLMPKYKYSIFQYGSDFVFETYRNEIWPGEEAFIISISKDESEIYSVAFLSLGEKTERLKLLSD